MGDNVVAIVSMYVPASSKDPVELVVKHSGLRMNLVDRESLQALPASWKVRGIYFLFGPGTKIEQYRAYVGMAPLGTVVDRINQHDKKKTWWTRALLVSHEADTFNGSEIGYLEGRFWNVLQNAVAAEVDNRKEPNDDTLTSAEEDALEVYVPPVMAALRAAGYSPDTVDQKPMKPLKAKKKYYGESVKDLIDAGFLQPDTQLEPLTSGISSKALVLADGKLVVNQKVFDAVSPAAVEASGNKSEPGWNFWGAPSGTGKLVSLFELRELYRGSNAEHQTKRAEHSSGHVEAPAGGLAGAAPKKSKVTIKTLVDCGYLKVGETLRPKSGKLAHRIATVNPNGSLDFEGNNFSSPSGAAKYLLGYQVAGWGVWSVEREGEMVLIDVLRKKAEDDDQ